LEKRVVFKSGDLLLEGILHVPAVIEHKLPGVAVCHPHPLYGGSMHNAVVEGICKALKEEGIVALRFNFRGVGASEGAYQEGIGERGDVEAAIEFLTSIEAVDPNSLGVAGYSFGAYVATYAASENPQVSAIALISPPFSMYNFTPLSSCRKPKLILWGSKDELVGLSAVDVAKIVAEPRKLILIEEADHFWMGKEDEVGKLVANFFKNTLKRHPKT